MNYIQRAWEGKNDWWRYLLTIITVFIGWQLIGVIPLYLLVFNQTDDYGQIMVEAETAFANMGIDNNLYLLAVLLTFAFGLFALLFSVKRIHKRSITSLVTSRKSIDWSRIFYGFGFWFVLSLLLMLVDFAVNPEHFVFNFQLGPFVILVLISVVFIPLQTSLEELIFRGYLMQGLGIWFRNAAIPFLFTSITFGLLHGSNPEVDKLGEIILIYYIGTGFFFGIITLMDQGSELALGMHAANNIVAAVFVTVSWGAFQTDALYKDISEPTLNMYMFLPVFVVYPLVIVFLARKYGWTDWKEKLFGRIDTIDAIDES